MTTGAAGVYHGLPPSTTTTTSASLSSSASSPLPSVSEPQSASGATLAAAAARHALRAASMEQGYLKFHESTTSLQEQGLAEAADTNLSRDRENLGKSFEIRDFEDVTAHVEAVEEELDICHIAKMMTAGIRVEECRGIIVRLEERVGIMVNACRKVQLFNLEKRFGFFMLGGSLHKRSRRWATSWSGSPGR